MAPGQPAGERVFFDLRGEVARLAAEGIQPTKLRVETRSDAGRWITGDPPIP